MQLSPSGDAAPAVAGGGTPFGERVRRARAHPWAAWVAGVAALAVLPLLTTDDDVLRYADLFLILSIAVVGLSLQQGRAGILNLGPGAYVGVGAYATATLAYHTHVPMPLPLLAAPLVAPACAVLVGGAALLLSRLHFAMVSLYAALLVPVIAAQGGTFTGGDNGLAGLEPLELAGHRPDGAALYAILAALLVAAVALGARIAAGPWGRAFVAVRVDDAAASSLGISPAATRLLAAVIAAAFGTVAGALLAQAWPGDCPSGFVGATCVVTPQLFGLDLSILLFAAVVIGGPASRAGPVVAVAMLVALRWTFDTHQAVGGDWQTVIYGGLLVLTAVALPRGLSATGDLLRGKPRQQDAPAAATTPALPPRRRPGAPLQVSGLRACFDNLVVLDDVALTARAGEVHALVGANGSGKTTLINCVSGLVQPERGEIRVAGRPLPHTRPWRAHRRARLGIARTFQTPRVQPDLSVLDNVLQALFVEARHARRHRPLARAGVCDGALRARAASMLAAVGLAGRADLRAAQLTHGERRLLEIARALVGDPLVVLLDEPSAGLDAAESDRLLAVLRVVRASGPAIVLVEHDLALVHAVADVVTVLDRGRVVACGPPSSLESGPRKPEAPG